MKRSTTLAAVLAAGLLFTFTACKKEAATTEQVAPETSNTVAVQNGRLAFKSTEEFYKYIDAATTDTKAANFKSLYAALREAQAPGKEPNLSATLQDLDKFNFPTSFLATLNENGEVKVGDEIIWYHDGVKYFIPASSEANLAAIKQNPKAIEKNIPSFTKQVGVDHSQANGRSTLDIKGLDAKHQWPFFPRNGGVGLVGSDRKYVHEIYGSFDGYYDALPGIKGYKAYLILRLKMEWKGSKGWNANASEERTENISVTGDATLPGISNGLGQYTLGPTFNVNESRVTRENWDKTLVAYTGYGTLTNNNWSLEIRGTITSTFSGADDSGRWANIGDPLW